MKSNLQQNKVFIDDLDKKIIDLLGIDACQSSKVLAKRLNVDSSTIRRRILQMVKNGAIYMTILPAHQKTGIAIEAIIAFEVDEREVEACLQTLCTFSECKFVTTTTGRFNVMATIFCSSTTDVFIISQKILAKHKGIKNSETFVCMNIVKSLNPLDCKVNA